MCVRTIVFSDRKTCYGIDLVVAMVYVSRVSQRAGSTPSTVSHAGLVEHATSEIDDATVRVRS